MIEITVDYFGQFRAAAGGIASESIRLSEPTSIESFVRELAARHGEAFGQLVSERSAGGVPTFLCFLDEQQAGPGDRMGTERDAVLTLLSPIAGG